MTDTNRAATGASRGGSEGGGRSRGRRASLAWSCLSAAALALGLPPGGAAHEGHDDRAPASGAAPTAVVTAGAPRFALATEVFELVGAIEGRRLTLWLDRYADGVPVVGARIELGIGDLTLVARPVGDVYVAELAGPLPAGRLPVSASVAAGGQADLLAGEVVVDAAGAALPNPGGATPSPAAPVSADWRIAVGVLAAGAAAAFAGWRATRRRAGLRTRAGTTTGH